MSKFVTLVLEPRFNDEYGEYANLPVFNAHGDVVGYTGGEVPETGNPCEFYVMDEEGFPVCHSASENAKLRERIHELEMEGSDHFYRTAYAEDANRTLEAENAKLRELAENLLMGFVYLETPQEQQECIDRALNLRRELDVLPMKEFDARELGIEVSE